MKKQISKDYYKNLKDKNLTNLSHSELLNTIINFMKENNIKSSEHFYYIINRNENEDLKIEMINMIGKLIDILYKG